MPKSRYALLDVIASKRDVTDIVGYRINNIYDINQKTYAIKLQQTGAEGGGKRLLLLESGIRFHCTSFTRDKSDNPSPFTMKLRKHLRGKRLVSCQQLGMDRVGAATNEVWVKGGENSMGKSETGKGERMIRVCTSVH